MYTHLLIEYANPSDLSDSITVPFKLLNNAVVPKWIKKVEIAQKLHKIDNPSRFYGFFASKDDEANYALRLINEAITTINSHVPIIEKTISDVHDQDTLNYLHHVFEVYHGLLGSQNTEYWNSAPQAVRTALADLNLCVHRCEGVVRVKSDKRHVVTWYGMPKKQVLAESDYELFTTTWKAGTVLLNYVEIGKTLEDHYTDNDHYIAKEAFQPFKHYSADFIVNFNQPNPAEAADHLCKIEEYYKSHMDYFGPWQPCFVAGKIPLAELDGELDLNQIFTHQYVKSVSFK